MPPDFLHVVRSRLLSQKLRRGNAVGRKTDNSQAVRCSTCQRILPLSFYSNRQEIISMVSGQDQKNTNAVCLTCEKLSCNNTNLLKPAGQESKKALSSSKNENDGNHVCNVCGKRFVSKQRMIQHQETHSTEKPHVCDVCGKTFRLEKYLHKHSSIHTNDRPFKCNSCGKTFRVAQSLTIHLRIHTGAKPYKCEVCGRMFRQLPSLYGHRRVHSKKTSTIVTGD